jgi:hypothetical protein
MPPLVHENRLAQLQRGFAEAIFYDDAPIPVAIRAASGPASASRFGVYRNNVIAGLINAIAARYPVVRKLLWPDTFEAVARRYVMAEPPRSPVLLEYGESFPRFLRTIGQGSAASCLADIAELEAARTRAYHAADARPLGRDAFARLSPDALPGLRLTLHPSLTLLKSRFPIVTIWEANSYATDTAITRWVEEPALIARPHFDVEVRRLTAGAYEFLATISEGRTLGAAIARALANAVDFDLAECFDTLIAADIVIGLRPAERAAPDIYN